VSFEFRAATTSDLQEIIDLMRTAFRANPEAPFLDRALLHWKYFEPGPDWIGSRSYVLRQDGDLLAHGCAWPVKLMVGGQSHTALTLVDWAGSNARLGAGLHIVLKMATLADALISIGGSEATRKIMPRIGFRTVDQQSLYARVLRPWRQFRTRPGAATPREIAREIARLTRNTGYSLAGRAATNGWSLRSVATVDPRLIADSSPGPGPSSLHGSELVAFMTRCPGARISSHELLKQGQPAGYVILSLVNGQSRIAEIRMRSREQQDWIAAVSATVNAAFEFPEASELIAWTSDPLLVHALDANGFRARDRRSIFVRDPGKVLADGAAGWDLTMLDDDSAFLSFPDHPYAT
jgi:hypothetical protein